MFFLVHDPGVMISEYIMLDTTDSRVREFGFQSADIVNVLWMNLQVQCPATVTDYTAYIGSVDVFDTLSHCAT